MSELSSEPPVPLGATARQRWDDLFERNAARGRGSWRSDLAAYCAAWGRWYDAEAVLAASADAAVITIRDDKGNVKSIGAAPEIKVSADALKLVRDLAARLVVD